MQTQQLNRRQKDFVLRRIINTHRERAIFIDLGTIRIPEWNIVNAFSFLSIPASIKIKVSDYRQGEHLTMLLNTATQIDSYGELDYLRPRHLTISLVFQNISSRFFSPECMPIADFTESLFSKKHVELVSLTLDHVNFRFDRESKAILWKLMNVNDLSLNNLNNFDLK